jgi:maleylacetoacetate isomerase
VRIALHLKGVPAEIHTIDLLKGEQHRTDYRSLNPEGVVPTLVEAGEAPLVQSLAILEYLDEKYPEPPLLPRGLRERAEARALAQLPAMDAHPLITPRVRNYLQKELGLDDAARGNWLRHWMETGNQALEDLLVRTGRAAHFSLGDTLTIADLCLVPHFTTALMLYDCNVAAYPTVERIYRNCLELPAFAETHPSKQPGATAGH